MLNSFASWQSPGPMKIFHYPLIPVTAFLIIAGALGMLMFTFNAATAAEDEQQGSVNSGYSALRLFLKDEQHLTIIRRVKTVITFEGISENSSQLIDEIADSSEQALEELEKLATLKPAIVFEEFPDESIGKATLDSLRKETAKEFLLYTDDFEKSLLISQSQILPVITHLARQLEEKETNGKRRAWLQKLANHYEQYYQQVYAKISISNRKKA